MEVARPAPWAEPGWLARVEPWLRAELDRLGIRQRRGLELVRTRPWAAIARVSTPSAPAARRLRRLAPAVASLADVLAKGLPSTIIHEEAHEANIFVRRGRARLLDWAEVSVSHPFAGMVNTLRDIAYRRRLRPNGIEVLRLRSAYVEPWTPFAPRAELNAMFDRGYLFGTLCRAMAWDQILADQPPEVRAEYGRNAAVWLNIFREGVAKGVRLGAS